MKISKNQKITIIKLLAQIVSTYHMIDVLSHYGPLVVAGVAGLSLGLGEYMISQEYAAMRDNNKLKKLMLFSLIGLSCVSALANIESFARFCEWKKLAGFQVHYVWVAGIIYSAMMPAVIVATSFIRLQEDKRSAKIAPKQKLQGDGHLPDPVSGIVTLSEAKKRYGNIPEKKITKIAGKRKRERELRAEESGLPPEIIKHLRAL